MMVASTGPRLSAVCDAFKHEGRWVLRVGGKVLQQKAADGDLFESLVPALVGALAEGHTDPLEPVLRRGGPARRLRAMMLLHELSAAGALTEGQESLPALEDLAPGAADPLDRVVLSSIPLAAAGDGALCRAVARRIEALGGVVTVVASPSELPAQAARTWLFCRYAPDLVAAEEVNRLALAHQAALLPVLPLGDQLVMGPLIRPGFTACFRCFELRWLGIAESIPIEESFFQHLRQVQPRARPWMLANIDRIADGVVRTLAQALRARGAGAPLTVTDAVTARARSGPLPAHPACDVCALPAAPPGRPADLAEGWAGPGVARPVATLLAELERLCHDKVGLVAETRDLGASPIGFATIVTRFAIPHPEGLRGRGENFSHGSGPDPTLARLVAIAEGLERYCGLSARRPDLIAPHREVAACAVSPLALPLYSPAQYRQPGFPFRPFDADRPESWSWAYNVTRGAPTLVPTAITGYGGKDGGLLKESSSGVAAHGSRAAALLNGAMELVERDAFMISWLNRLSPPRIELDGVEDATAAACLGYIAAAGYTPVLLDLTTDLAIPVCAALALRTDGDGPALLIGAGAALGPAIAVRKAVVELYSAVHYNVVRQQKAPAEPFPFESVRSPTDHSLAYAHPARLEVAQFLWASPRTVRLDELGGTPGVPSVAEVVERLARQKLELLAVDLTTDDVLPTGLRVVRAIIPGLQPLAFGPEGLRLGGSRLYQAPVQMGYAARPRSEGELNPHPHCFP
jgi:ribosomal protein S12 methylthiotransferase accessory factor